GLYDTREWTYIKKDQTKFPVQLTVTTVKKNEIITGYLGVAVDISYIKQTEREIHTLLNVAKDQNERLKNFAHIVSHNLRSHSGNITMMMDLAVHEQPELLENELIRMLQTASTNLQETIMHLNEVVLMNSAVNENLHSINLSHYMKETIQNMHAVLFNLDIDINNTIDSNINILALPAYLESILLNLMTNAVKYRSEDRLLKINVSTEIIGEYAVLTIEDNGIGIDLKKNGFKIFGMYKTFHTNKDARGIGLFITKNQIEAINGKIEVTSQEHIGTTFKVYFRHEKN
ncbi:MAG: PAS domain-containing sensor histidine kinase, partial [Flavobacterium sp.]|nr:PAS domain-containing sensor histidine kinase [Flavobacterium sp.]